jgi:hypothetical protein
MRALGYLAILLTVGLIAWMNFAYPVTSEGFDGKSDYQTLVANIKSSLKPYCELSSFVQSKLKEMYMKSNPGVSDSDADAYVSKTYLDVYSCADDSADSRASCSNGMAKRVEARYVSCETYMKLPSSGTDDDLASALRNIPDDLPVRVQVELEWYGAVIQKLQGAIDAAKNMGKTEGFYGGTCSPAAAQAKREQMRRKQLEDESADCTLSTLASEVQRVKALMSSSTLQSAVASSAGISAKMNQQLADMEAIKAKWDGNNGPKKVYPPPFAGGDRSASLLYTLGMNQ